MTPLTVPSTRLVAVTKSDSTDLSVYENQRIYVGGAGDLTVIPLNGGATPVLLPSVPAGTVLDLQVSKVMSTGTAATGVVLMCP